ncbi:MAG: hypothetical protein ACPGN3_16825 [Opitutales bacterium]
MTLPHIQTFSLSIITLLAPSILLAEETILSDTFSDGVLLDAELFDGARKQGFWEFPNTDLIKTTEVGGKLNIAYTFEEDGFGNVWGGHSSEQTAAWDFFSQEIILSVRGLSIDAFPTAVRSYYGFTPKSSSSYAQDDGIALLVQGDGTVELLAHIDSGGPRNFGNITFISEYVPNGISGFDLALDGTNGSGVDYTVTLYHDGDTISRTGQITGMTVDNWSDVKDGDGGLGHSRLMTRIQTQSREDFTYQISEISIKRVDIPEPLSIVAILGILSTVVVIRRKHAV